MVPYQLPIKQNLKLTINVHVLEYVVDQRCFCSVRLLTVRIPKIWTFAKKNNNTHSSLLHNHCLLIDN